MQLLELVRDRLEHELVVAVRLLRFVALGGVVRPLGGLGFLQQLVLVLDEELELAPDRGRRSGCAGSSSKLAVEVEVRRCRGVPGQRLAGAERPGAGSRERVRVVEELADRTGQTIDVVC